MRIACDFCLVNTASEPFLDCVFLSLNNQAGKEISLPFHDGKGDYGRLGCGIEARHFCFNPILPRWSSKESNPL